MALIFVCDIFVSKKFLSPSVCIHVLLVEYFTSMESFVLFILSTCHSFPTGMLFPI